MVGAEAVMPLRHRVTHRVRSSVVMQAQGALRVIGRFIGSPMVIVALTGLLAVWFTVNLVGPVEIRFDNRSKEKRFYLLNLTLSILASYSAPIILYCGNLALDRLACGERTTGEANKRMSETVEYVIEESDFLMRSVSQPLTRQDFREEICRFKAALLESRVPPGVDP